MFHTRECRDEITINSPIHDLRHTHGVKFFVGKCTVRKLIIITPPKSTGKLVRSDLDF